MDRKRELEDQKVMQRATTRQRDAAAAIGNTRQAKALGRDLVAGRRRIAKLKRG